MGFHLELPHIPQEVRLSAFLAGDQPIKHPGAMSIFERISLCQRGAFRWNHHVPGCDALPPRGQPGLLRCQLGSKRSAGVCKGFLFSTASLIFEILEEGVLRERRKTLQRNPKRRNLRTFVMLVFQMRKTPLVLKGYVSEDAEAVDSERESEVKVANESWLSNQISEEEIDSWLSPILEDENEFIFSNVQEACEHSLLEEMHR